MAMTLEEALGRKIEDIEDAVIAHAMFGFAKHGYDDDEYDSCEEATKDKIDRMSNTEFLQYLSMGFGTLEDLKQEKETK